MNVGLVTGSSMPSERHAPRTSVVLPEPSSPRSEDDVARAQQACERAAERLGLGRRLRGALDHALRRGRAEPRRPACARPRRGRDSARRAGSSGADRAASRRDRRTGAGRAGPGAARSRPRAPSASTACRARRPGGRAGRAGRVVERERHLVLLAVHARDPERAAGEELRGEVPERRDDARPDELDLAEEVRLARGDLGLERVAILRRPALEHVREVDVLAARARCRRAAARAARLPGPRTGARPGPRDTRAPRRRSSARRRDRPSRRRPGSASRRGGQRTQPAVSAA